MSQQHTFIKETITNNGRDFKSYTTLTGILKSENLFHLYATIRCVILKSGIFKYQNIIIRRVPLFHQKHRK
jgi:hypothetical protein